MSSEVRSAERGAVSGAGRAVVLEVEVGRERVAKEEVAERGVARGEGRVEVEWKEGVAGADEVGVTRVERKAVSRGEDRTLTGTSSSMLEGTSLLSIKLKIVPPMSVEVSTIVESRR